MRNIRAAAIFLELGSLLLLPAATFGEEGGHMVKVPAEKARVYVTDSQSWEMNSAAGGGGGGFGSVGSGGSRPQTAEIIKTFGERCSDVTVNNIRQKSDYIVVLEHEGGKSVLLHRNKVAVFARLSGDSVVSKSTYSLGASVQEACEGIRKDWAKNWEVIRTAEAEEPPIRPRPFINGPVGTLSNRPSILGMTRVMVISNPAGGDISVDGSFVGNTPSTINVPDGDHTIAVTKSGFKAWERKIKSMGGNVRLNADLEPQQDAKN